MRNYILSLHTNFMSSCDLIHIIAIYCSFLVLASGVLSPIQTCALRNISAFSGQGGRARTYLILAHRDLEDGAFII